MISDKVKRNGMWVGLGPRSLLYDNDPKGQRIWLSQLLQMAIRTMRPKRLCTCTWFCQNSATPNEDDVVFRKCEVDLDCAGASPGNVQLSYHRVVGQRLEMMRHQRVLVEALHTCLLESDFSTTDNTLKYVDTHLSFKDYVGLVALDASWWKSNDTRELSDAFLGCWTWCESSARLLPSKDFIERYEGRPDSSFVDVHASELREGLSSVEGLTG